jgi:hypothetical protein
MIGPDLDTHLTALFETRKKPASLDLGSRFFSIPCLKGDYGRVTSGCAITNAW